MDLDLVRTFLAVHDTGNFNRAAERLHITQSTVSSRIRNLEDQIGQLLFLRSRAGTEVTSAGRRFHGHATTLMRAWLHARQEMVLPEILQQVLTVGGQFTLWDELLIGWLPWMRKYLPEVAVRAEIGTPEFLMQRLVDGTLDIGVMYNPQGRAGFTIDKLMEDRLVAVATDPDSKGPGDTGYIFVDWGAEFLSEHANAFPGASLPAVGVSHGLLALSHMLNVGGSAYLPLRTVRAHLKAGRLHRVKAAPTFRRPAFLVYPEGSVEESHVAKALDGMRRIAGRSARQSG